MEFKGKAWKYGDDVDTDVIIPARYLTTSDPGELAAHCMEEIDDGFVARVVAGDVMIGGRNFGSGSSREHAPIAIKASGISVIVAESFARIFFRNAINVGLPVLQCDTSGIGEGDELQVDLTAGEVRDLTTGAVVPFVPLPAVMVTILGDGGLVPHVKKHGGFALPEG
jgi:3-isopropylmalate/(R)-2-methylmalate dehydratase small subunit